MSYYETELHCETLLSEGRVFDLTSDRTVHGHILRPLENLKVQW